MTSMEVSRPLNNLRLAFDSIPTDYRELFVNYLLLWSHFEANVLVSDTSLSSIIQLITKWQSADVLDFEFITQQSLYFKKLFFLEGKAIFSLKYLMLIPRPQYENFINTTLSSDNSDLVSQLTSMILFASGFRKHLRYLGRFKEVRIEDTQLLERLCGIISYSIEFDRLSKNSN